jgi:hypothetical protein
VRDVYLSPKKIKLKTNIYEVASKKIECADFGD